MAAYGSESSRSDDALQTADFDPKETLMRLTPIKMTTDLVFRVRLFCSITFSHWGELRGPLREIVPIFRPPFEDHGL